MAKYHPIKYTSIRVSCGILFEHSTLQYFRHYCGCSNTRQYYTSKTNKLSWIFIRHEHLIRTKYCKIYIALRFIKYAFFANKNSLLFFWKFYYLFINNIINFLFSYFLNIRIYYNCKEINLCLKSFPLLQFSTECFLYTKKSILLILSHKILYLAKSFEYYIKSQSCISYFNRFRMTKM